VNELMVTFANRAYHFAPGHAVRIGRSADNSVVVQDPRVSRLHACVTWTPEGWRLDDLGKGRTYVGGLAVASVPVRQPLEVHLAGPLGPGLRIELAPPAGSGNSAGPAPRTGQAGPRAAGGAARRAAGTVTGLLPAGRPPPEAADSPGGDLATAVHILVPVRSWLKHPGWKQGSRLLVIAYGLLPSIFVVLFAGATSQSTPGWAYSLAIAPLWAVAFWLIIRPGPVTRLTAWLGLAIIAAVLILLPVLTIPWEHALGKTASPHNPLLWIYAVGLPEEVTKALPVLLAALLLRHFAHITLDVRSWMFLGTIAGLTFGVWESVLYTSTLMTIRQSPVQGVLLFALRVFVDGFQHAVWAGIAAFFIGIGVNYRRRRIPLIAFGISLPAVLHGLNDWSTQLTAHWLWIGFEALSLVLFIGYTMSAASIERQVRDTPLFRGESMVMDRADVAPEGRPR
jgi:RsiW-degrading membrane proteinase PrsW (M82 family)